LAIRVSSPRGPPVMFVRWVLAACNRLPHSGVRIRSQPGADRKDTAMGLGDKISNAAEEAKGKIKEATGKATDNGSLEAEGKGDQASANVKQAGENVKDTVKDALN
jgi:uncharacterized protein YjbJ (UPF0337 family)